MLFTYYEVFRRTSKHTRIQSRFVCDTVLITTNLRLVMMMMMMIVGIMNRYAMVTTIRLRFDGRSTACQRSLSAQ